MTEAAQDQYRSLQHDAEVQFQYRLNPVTETGSLHDLTHTHHINHGASFV